MIKKGASTFGGPMNFVNFGVKKGGRKGGNDMEVRNVRDG